MKLYSGNVGKRSQLAFLRDNDLGRFVVATHFRTPIDGIPWALDNGAYGAWRKGESFPARAFMATLEKIPRTDPPDFAVCPDLVAGGIDSLVFSYVWRGRLSALGYDWIPWQLAVQDEIDRETMRTQLESWQGVWSGIFVGGTLEWKRRTAESWIELAHEFDLPCHIGRVGQIQDLLWAESIGADSVDSSSWARNESLERIVLAYREQRRVDDGL